MIPVTSAWARMLASMPRRATRKDGPSFEFCEVMHQLDLIQEHFQQLETRLSELEQLVRGAKPRSRKSRPRSEP
jgi:hypothetical protein